MRASPRQKVYFYYLLTTYYLLTYLIGGSMYFFSGVLLSHEKIQYMPDFHMPDFTKTACHNSRSRSARSLWEANARGPAA